MDMFLNVRRSKSDESFFGLGRIISQQIEPEKQRPLIISIPNSPAPNSSTEPGFRLFRKIQKEKKKNESDYCKNICGYITKKIIR